MCTGITPRYRNSHTPSPESLRDTEYCICTDTGAQACNRLRSGSVDTRAHTQIPTDTQAGTGIGREPSNPPQSRAPPRGPAAQGATSDQASGRLQIRSALSPPAGSGDPPPVPSAPASLRAAAPFREGPGPPRSGSRDQPAPAPGPHRPPCSRASRASAETQEPKTQPA